MDGVVVRVQPPAVLDGHALEEGADLGGVARVEDVPKGAGEAAGSGRATAAVFHHDVTA